MSRAARTLTEMILEVRQRADMVNSTFVTDLEITRWINLGITKLYDMLIKANGQDYYLRCYTTTTSSADPTVSLPHDFHSILTVRINQSSGFTTLDRIQLRSELDFLDNTTAYAGTEPARYMFQGQTRLRFLPNPTGSRSIQIWYVPLAPSLSSSVDTVSLTVTGTSGENTLEAASSLDATQLYPYMRLEDSGTGAVIDVKDTTIYLDTSLTGNVSGVKSFDDADRFDGIHGWEEYVVLDAAIRALTKEESDPSPLYAEKQEIVQRINEMADSRDKGSPKRLVDVTGGWANMFDGAGRFYW